MLGVETRVQLPQIVYSDNDRKLQELHDSLTPEASKENLDKLIDAARSIELSGNAVIEDLAHNSKDPTVKEHLWVIIQSNQDHIDKLKQAMRENPEDKKLVEDCKTKAARANALQLALQLAVPDSLLEIFGKVDKVSKGKLAEQIDKFTREAPKELAITQETRSFLAARILRTNPSQYTVIHTSSHAKRSEILGYISRFGLPASHIHPFCSSLTAAYEKMKENAPQVEKLRNQLQDKKLESSEKKRIEDELKKLISTQLQDYNFPSIIERVRKDNPQLDFVDMLPEDFFRRYELDENAPAYTMDDI